MSSSNVHPLGPNNISEENIQGLIDYNRVFKKTDNTISNHQINQKIRGDVILESPDISIYHQKLEPGLRFQQPIAKKRRKKVLSPSQQYSLRLQERLKRKSQVNFLKKGQYFPFDPYSIKPQLPLKKMDSLVNSIFSFDELIQINIPDEDQIKIEVKTEEKRGSLQSLSQTFLLEAPKKGEKEVAMAALKGGFGFRLACKHLDPSIQRTTYHNLLRAVVSKALTKMFDKLCEQGEQVRRLSISQTTTILYRIYNYRQWMNKGQCGTFRKLIISNYQLNDESFTRQELKSLYQSIHKEMRRKEELMRRFEQLKTDGASQTKRGNYFKKPPCWQPAPGRRYIRDFVQANIKGLSETDLQSYMDRKYPRFRWERKDIREGVMIIMRQGLGKMSRFSDRIGEEHLDVPKFGLTEAEIEKIVNSPMKKEMKKMLLQLSITVKPSKGDILDILNLIQDQRSARRQAEQSFGVLKVEIDK